MNYHDSLHHSLVKQVIKPLEEITAGGHRAGNIFFDFIRYTAVALEAAPRMTMAKVNGEPFEETEEAQEIYEYINGKYKPQHIQCMHRAAGALMSVPEHGFYDIPGDVYQEWGWPSAAAGQFFTPMPVARMMAKMVNVTTMERITSQFHRDPVLQARYIMWRIEPEGPLKRAKFLANVLPWIRPTVFTKESVHDPACGSGVMFLAAASELPWWVVQTGLIQFYGQDRDLTCVYMARVNTMLYGLNGRNLGPMTLWACAVMEQAGITPAEPPPVTEADRVWGSRPVAEMGGAAESEPVQDNPPFTAVNVTKVSQTGRITAEELAQYEQGNLFNLLKEP